MQFMLILNETPQDFARRADPAEVEAYWGGWNAFIGAMAQAGVIVTSRLPAGFPPAPPLDGPRTPASASMRRWVCLLSEVLCI